MNQERLFESVYKESMEDAVIPFNNVKKGMIARDFHNKSFTISGKDPCHGFGDDPDDENSYFECEGVKTEEEDPKASNYCWFPYRENDGIVCYASDNVE